MSLGNRKLAHTGQSVHLAGIFVTEQSRCLTIAAWQITVGFLTCLVYIVLEWTGHWTQGKYFFVFFLVSQYEHTFFVMIPVAGDLVQIGFGHQRCLGSHITAACFLVFDPSLHLLNHFYTVWHDQWKSLADHIYRCEQFQFAAQFVMVSLLDLFQVLQMCVQVCFLCVSSSVDSGKHLIFLTASPVRSGG